MTTRLDLLQRLVRTRNVRSYLEIGVGPSEATFGKIDVDVKVGVDPDVSGAHLYTTTSDEFFGLRGTWKFPEEPFDLIFIDGEHEAAQALRDVEHALEILAPGGALVLHDCNPPVEWMQRVPRPVWRLDSGETYERPWCGDVWRAWVQLRCRPDLDCACLDGDYGCGVVLVRENTDHSKPPLYIDTGRMDYTTLAANRARLLRLMDWEEIVAWLSEIPLDKTEM